MFSFVLGAAWCRAEDDGASVGESGEPTVGGGALQLTKRPATQGVRRRVAGGFAGASLFNEKQ